LASERVLVDTDVFSYALRGDRRAELFQPLLIDRTLSLSFMSVAELYYGAYIARWGAARVERLRERLTKYVVLPYDYEVCRLWGEIRARRKAQGREIGHADAWVAATALRFACPLATNNGQDFAGIPGLVVLGQGSSAPRP
jgi:predicted nucleic acid-binding protein